MWLNKIPAYLVLGFCLITAYALFNIKDSVLAMRAELKEVIKQTEIELDTIHILKAELAYLSSPERLKILTSQFLKLKSTKVAQMIKDPLLHSESFNSTKRIASTKILNQNVKWRYKKGPSKYLTMVSKKGS